VYTPKGGGVRTTSDVNMFLTRHRLLHTSVPRVPMSISHCWINTELERAKLEHGDHGYKDPATPVPVEVTPRLQLFSPIAFSTLLGY